MYSGSYCTLPLKLGKIRHLTDVAGGAVPAILLIIFFHGI